MSGEFRFTNDWFANATEGRRRSPRESTSQLWDRLLTPMTPRPRRIIETGVCEGRSAFWFIKNLKPDLYVGVDPWRPDRRFHQEIYDTWRSNFFHNMAVVAGQPMVEESSHLFATTAGETRCVLVDLPSEDYLRDGIDSDFPGQVFDLAYADGEHSSLGAITDFIMLWRKLAPGGILIMDDFDRRYHNARPAVHEAVLAFWSIIEHNAHKIPITDATTSYENKRQVWLRKRCN